MSVWLARNIGRISHGAQSCSLASRDSALEPGAGLGAGLSPVPARKNGNTGETSFHKEQLGCEACSTSATRAYKELRPWLCKVCITICCGRRPAVAVANFGLAGLRGGQHGERKRGAFT